MLPSTLSVLYRLARRDPFAAWLIAGFLIGAALLLIFVWIANEVGEGEFGHFDEWLLLAFRVAGDPGNPIGQPVIEESARDVSALGSNAVLGFIVLATIGYLLIARKRAMAVLVAAAVASGTLVSTLLKIGYARPRPELVPHATEVFTASFPSGHATLSAVVYLTLAALLARAHSAGPLRIYFAALAIILTVAVGISRVYLGVHYPTDVIAGWCLGAAWALLFSAAAGWLQSRHRIEPPGQPS